MDRLIHVGSLIMLSTLVHVADSGGVIQCFLVHQRAAETTSRHEVARAQGAVQNPKVTKSESKSSKRIVNVSLNDIFKRKTYYKDPLKTC